MYVVWGDYLFYGYLVLKRRGVCFVFEHVEKAPTDIDGSVTHQKDPYINMNAQSDT